MTTRRASCSCGQLRLTADGDPARVSICRCLACQRRTGSIYGAQARFAADPDVPKPMVSVYETRRHDWVVVPHDVEHFD